MAKLREAENIVGITGVLAKNNLENITYNRDGKTVDAIRGNVTVLVPQTINGEEKNTEVLVDFFSSKLTKAGQINPSWDSLNKAMTDLKSIAATGSIETADKVSIGGAKLKNNAFVGRDGEIVDYTQIDGAFINKVRGPYEPEARFILEFMVASVARVSDKDGVELDPPVLNVNVITPKWGGNVDVVRLKAKSPGVVSAIEQYWEPNMCFKASGRLNFTTETREVSTEVDFGEPVTKTYTNSVREYLITGGSRTPMENEHAFDLEEIQKALADRKEFHESLKQKNKTKTAPAQEKTVSFDDLGF